jgi:hypothetical protein
VRRAILIFAIVGAVLASGVSAGSGAEQRASARKIEGHITVRVRYKNGPWSTRLSVKLHRYLLNEFRVCGVWNWPATRRFTCLGAGEKLPSRTLLRMEQNPIGKAMRRADSPGWGLLGISSDPVIKTPLSNAVTNNVLGTFYYRATLRDFQGHVLLTSNKVSFTWHR